MRTFYIGTRANLAPALLDAVWQYRYELFVEKLRWHIPEASRRAHGRAERDQFDTERAVYVVAQADTGRINGFARLLPTDRAYLLAEFYASLVDGPTPCFHHVWEMSRFASDAEGGGGREVFAQTLAAAKRLGATSVVGVMSTTIERKCLSYGFDLCRLGRPQYHGPERLVACSVDVARLRFDYESTVWKPSSTLHMTTPNALNQRARHVSP